ncbi:MAG TPA: response regulator [Stellaceae bacterium]
MIAYMAEPEQNVPRVCRVLIVEDDPAVQHVFKTLLAAEGFECLVARDAPSTRSALAAGDVDVAIMDVMLPGAENGLALAQEAAERGCGVIVVTGHHDRYDAVEASGHKYLFKPFRVRALLDVLDEVLRRANAECRVNGQSYRK